MPLEHRVVRRNGTASICRGPLLYTLGIEPLVTKYTPLDYRDGSHLSDSKIVTGSTNDYFLKPTSPWKYTIDPDTIQVEDNRDGNSALHNPIFSLATSPTSLTVDAYPIDWQEEKVNVANPPLQPSFDLSAKTKIRLVPFGATQLHIADFPIVEV